MSKKYATYKDSGIEWIGEIPKHWKIRPLKYNTYLKARVGWHGLKSDEFGKEGAYCVTGTDFYNGRIRWEGCYRVSNDRYGEDPYIQLKEGDLLITKDGTIGKTAIVINLPGEATLNSGVFVVRPKKDYTSRFLYWVLNSCVFTEFVNYHSKGSTIIHLYQDTFCNLPLALPAPQEQEFITNYLDQKTALIDDTIQKKQRLIDLIQEERTALINQAVTRGLDPDVKLKPSGLKWLGDVPEHWELKKLKYFSTLISGAAFNSSEFKREGDVRVLKISNIQHDWIDWSDVEYLTEEYAKNFKHFEILDGDLIFALTRPIISTGIKSARAYNDKDSAPVLLNQRNATLRVSQGVNPDFIYYVTHSRYFFQLFEASIDNTGQQPNISPIAISNFEILLPPLSEQNVIVEYITQALDNIKAVQQKIQKEITLLQEYRAALINEVITGKRRVFHDIAPGEIPMMLSEFSTRTGKVQPAEA